MPDIPISLACWDYDRMLALKDGSVKPEGVQLTYLPVMMPEPAFRMLHYREFDAAEMSLSWYSRTVTSSPRPFIAIPVFPSRVFRHGYFFYNLDKGIKGPRVDCASVTGQVTRMVPRGSFWTTATASSAASASSRIVTQ